MIGQAPPRSGDPPLTGRFMRRLLAVSGLSRERYLAATSRANLLHRFPGKEGKGDAFPTAPARSAARAMRPTLVGETVVLCGRRVAAAFGHRDPRLPYLRWSTESEPFAWAVLPHPSGINRWWNSPKNREAAGEFLRLLLEEPS